MSSSRRRICDDICQEVAKRRRGVIGEIRRSEHTLVSVEDGIWVWEKCCQACGAAFVTASRAVLCDGCWESRNGERNALKNSRRRGAPTGDPVRLEEIAERDGFRCHLCGRHVDMARMSPDSLSPSLDHLVPISTGGVHDPSNVALAHRGCNSRRGANGAVQLRLVG